MPILAPFAMTVSPVPQRAPDVVISAPGQTADVARFTSGEVRCDGQPIAHDGIVPPFATVVTRYDSSPALVEQATYRFAFAIDVTGRPRTIRREEMPRSTGYFLDTSDLAPSLAVSRFPVGTARQRCSIAYTVSVTPVASAPLSLLYELASGPGPGATSGAVLARVTPPDADCRRGPGPYRQLNQPAFETIAQAAGTWSWTFLAYDVDKAGKPTGIRVLGSAGNRALDQASVRALAANRYAPGPGYRGCSYHFYRLGPGDDQRLELPADTPADNGDLPACAIDPATMRSLLDGGAYPRAFARRRVEGVVAIGFDTASWGTIGDLKVIASEPDAAFGEAARGALSNAKVAASETGHRGCVRRIRFKLPPEPRATK